MSPDETLEGEDNTSHLTSRNLLQPVYSYTSYNLLQPVYSYTSYNLLQPVYSYTSFIFTQLPLTLFTIFHFRDGAGSCITTAF